MELIRRQLDEQLNPVKSAMIERPPSGWVKIIREALGMTQSQLGRKIDISSQAVQKIEDSEASNTISLKTLEKAAASLDCKLFYVLVPNNSLQNKVEKQILKKATSIVESTSHSMNLENQKTNSKEIEFQIQKVTNEIKNKKNVSMIWDE